MSGKYTKTNLMCPNCGEISNIQRHSSKLKSKGHIKDLNCPFCQSMQKMIEIPNIDEYNYAIRNSEKLTELKIYSNKRSTIEFNIKLTIGTFNKWEKLNSDPFNEKIFNQAEYSLLETIILNFLNEEKFRKKMICRYEETDRRVKDVVFSESMNFRLNSTIYQRFMDYCDILMIKPSILIQAMVDEMYDSDIRFNFENKKERRVNKL